jgi:FSR family fosmidomycin resistance protein-like MFS transporter
MTPTAPRMNRLGLFLLGLGHLAVDINPGALPALLPIVFLDLHLSYTTAALVVTVGNVTSSIVQPLFGVLSDRLSRGWLVPLGCLLGTVGLACAGLAPTYPLLLAAVVVSSLGVAVFHPEAVRTANQFAGPRRATGMALFTVGGNFGVALGPILLGTLLAFGGRSGTVSWLAFAVVFPPILYMAMRRVSADAAPAAASSRAAVDPTPTRRRALVLLLAVIFFRQWTQTGLTTFIPLYFVTYLHEQPVVANQLLSALLFGSVAGTLLGGPLADRWGRKPVLSISLFLTVPLLVAFLRGAPGPLSPLVLFLAGAVMLSTASVVVVMGQELLPRSTGLAAGLTIGFASGLAGLGGVLLGGIADRFGVAETMALVCLLPLPGALLSLRLPDTLQRVPAASPTPA